jgi:sirohydrochlorin ferrochelatase
MQTESILLIGRNTGNAQEVFETHAARLRQRRAVDRVVVGTYDTEPVRELQDRLQGMSADTVYAVPMFFAHRHETTSGVPAVLSYVSGDVAYCEPPGNSPAITGVIQDRASNHVPPGPEQSLVLVGFGSNSRPYDRKTTEYHAARLREQSRYGEVVPCYLLQNPAVECVRYNVNGKRTVAVPLFFTRSAPTADTIPEKLELERGGIE